MNYNDLYYHVLTVIASMLRQYGSSLGLLVPGYPEQLAVQRWLSFRNRRTVFYLRVMRDDNFDFRGKSPFIKAVQAAIDHYCYNNGLNRVFILDAKTYPGNVIALAVSV